MKMTKFERLSFLFLVFIPGILPAADLPEKKTPAIIPEHAKLEHRHTQERKQSERRVKQLINEHERTLAALLGNAVTRIHHQLPHDDPGDHNRVALMTNPTERGKTHAQYV